MLWGPSHLDADDRPVQRVGPVHCPVRIPAQPRQHLEGAQPRGDQGRLMPGERVVTQSEVTRAVVLLEDSPCL